jgi:hypothetical protein
MVKKTSIKIGILVLCFVLTSVSLHRFYVSVTEINFVSTKKEIQITSRYFIDDLNNCFEKKYKTKFYLCSSKESEEQLTYLKKYLADNFSIKVNVKAKDMIFLTKEIEDDVMICYFKIKDVSKINTLELKNTVFYTWTREELNLCVLKI